MVGHSQALKTLWTDTCTITRKISRTNAATRREEFTDTVICKNEPCRISYSYASSPAVPESGTAGISRTAKLFIRKDLDIPAGCRISITRGGKTESYGRSGSPAVYSDHQEIELALLKEKA